MRPNRPLIVLLALGIASAFVPLGGAQGPLPSMSLTLGPNGILSFGGPTPAGGSDDASASHDSGGVERHVCGGSAPLETECTTGNHSLASYKGFSLGFPLQDPGVTATLEVVLTHQDGEIRFRCWFGNGQPYACQLLSIDIPPVGASFEFHCTSSFALPTLVPILVPGGFGNWQCFVQHDTDPSGGSE